jgi:8-hydroxy-5-deazaflavin:NADPH oxidoreductase
VKGTAAEPLVKSLSAALAGRTVIDTSNPIAEAPPVDGVLQFFTTLNESLLERLQRAVPEARFVKAFSSVGSALMVNPHLPGGKPTMFICGADAGAKRQVTGVLEKFGWEVEDMGGPAAARAIEPLCMLWCIPGFRQNDWTHAFKMLRR